MSLHDAYLEDLQVGLETVTQARTITEADVMTFAELSGDDHPLHTDAAFAAVGPFGERVAHGLLGLAVASGLVQQLGIAQNALLALRSVQCSFKHPVLIGDAIYAHVQVVHLKAAPRLGGGLVELRVKVYNQVDRLVQSGSWELLVRDRASALSGNASNTGGKV